jgi:hypothetical protein
MRPKLSPLSFHGASLRAGKKRDGQSKPAQRQNSDPLVPARKVAFIDGARQPSTPKPKLIATDDQTNRIVLGIGKQRLAIDLTIHTSELKPWTDDAPVVVSILTRRKKRKAPRHEET